jgi:hypothetical protein
VGVSDEPTPPVRKVATRPRPLYRGLWCTPCRYLKLWSYLHDRLRDAARDEEDSSSSGQRQLPPEVSLFNDVTISQLLHPDMTAHAVQVGYVDTDLMCLCIWGDQGGGVMLGTMPSQQMHPGPQPHRL